MKEINILLTMTTLIQLLPATVVSLSTMTPNIIQQSLSSTLATHTRSFVVKCDKRLKQSISSCPSVSTEEEDLLVEIALQGNHTTPILNVVEFSGLNQEEFTVLVKTVEEAYTGTVGIEIPCNTRTAYIPITRNKSGSKENGDDLVGVVRGALGRVFRLQTNLDEDSMELLRSSISERIDHLIYETGEMLQPVLISIFNNNDDGINVDINDIIKNEILQWGLRIPIHKENNEDSNTYTANKFKKDQHDDTDNNDVEITMFTPTSQIEIDGADTQIDDDSGTTSTTFWDTSSIVVFDELVNDDLRKRLLTVVTSRGDDTNDWNDTAYGPDPNRWVRGGLQDIPDTDDNDNDDSDQGEEEEEENVVLSCWGLQPEAIEDLCYRQHDAIQEFESILTDLFPQFVVTRLPEAVYGECVSPLTANAPVAGEGDDVYDYHIDGDPLQTPPSPWTDVYGRYPNRSPGKPRFVSCIVYLNDEWNEHWGAPTRFYDTPTNESYDIFPLPGRCIIMDQDIQHTVVPPKPNLAGNIPRYSLVWKLILHPKTEHQDMMDLFSSPRSPEPLLFGSAGIRSSQ